MHARLMCKLDLSICSLYKLLIAQIKKKMQINVKASNLFKIKIPNNKKQIPYFL